MKYYSRPKKVSVVTVYLALLGMLITVSQTIIILVQGDPLCLNQGCEIVESLTTVPPVFFNGAGFLFFLLIYLCARPASRGGQLSRRLLINLLVAGIGTEAVLISFQYYIAQTFCWYCLIIFALIALLNISLGIKQVVRALFIFAVISMAFASLDFRAGANPSENSYQDGIFATRPGLYESDVKLHLFFSSTCGHCENVLQVVNDADQVTVFFNPIDEIDNLKVEDVEYTQSYSSQSNLDLLSALNINEIPVLLVQQGTKIEVIRGENAINEHIIALGRALEPGEAESQNQSDQSQSVDYTQMSSTTDGCEVDTDCEEGELIPQ